MAIGDTVRRFLMFHINTRSSEPIFEQLYQQVKRYIAISLLKEEDQLPTVRTLARDLEINPSTVSKAYQLCERDGLIYSIPGKGFFVSSNNQAHKVIEKDLYADLANAYLSLIEFGEKHDNIIYFIQKNRGGQK